MIDHIGSIGEQDQQTLCVGASRRGYGKFKQAQGVGRGGIACEVVVAVIIVDSV